MLDKAADTAAFGSRTSHTGQQGGNLGQVIRFLGDATPFQTTSVCANAKTTEDPCDKRTWFAGQRVLGHDKGCHSLMT